MRSSHVVRLVLAGMIVLPSGAAAASPHITAGTGGVGIRLVDAPPTSADPSARLYIVGRLAPGTTSRRVAEVSNGTTSSIDVEVYPAAAGLSRGTFEFASARDRNDLSSWTSVSRALLHLPPGAKALETVTIKVPDEIASGARYGVVWAQTSRRASTGSVTLVNRVGIRMYISIGRSGAPAASFAIGVPTAARATSGEPVVFVTVHNTGRRTLDLRGGLVLSKGPGGLRAGPFPVRLRPALAPNHSEAGTVRLDSRLPRGPWRARIRLTAESMGQERTATLTFPRLSRATRESNASPPAVIQPPVLAGAIVLLLLTAVALTLLRARRRPAAFR